MSSVSFELTTFRASTERSTSELRGLDKVCINLIRKSLIHVCLSFLVITLYKGERLL